MPKRIFITERDVLYEMIVTVEPVGHISSSYYRGKTGTLDVVFVTCVPGFNWSIFDPFVLETLPRVKLDRPWRDVPANEKARLRTRVGRRFPPLDESKFVTWEDSISETLKKIGINLPQLRKSPASRTRAWMDDFADG